MGVPLLKAQLVKHLEPFLTRLQASEPLLPITHYEVTCLLHVVEIVMLINFCLSVLKQTKALEELVLIKIDDSRNLIVLAKIVSYGPK